MRQSFCPKLEAGRLRTGHYASSVGVRYGAFQIQGPCGMALHILAADGAGDPITEGWEHVSVSGPWRCPNWTEMCFVKELFWSDDEVAVQFHPRRADYVNCHPNCLHLWSRPGIDTPPRILVGP